MIAKFFFCEYFLRTILICFLYYQLLFFNICHFTKLHFSFITKRILFSVVINEQNNCRMLIFISQFEIVSSQFERLWSQFEIVWSQFEIV
ncbi:hypothetical protein C0J52_09325 [Blattella germanica]|nr:hypothetical protein C0J52_09325 [Blattella germanica]